MQVPGIHEVVDEVARAKIVEQNVRGHGDITHVGQSGQGDDERHGAERALRKQPRPRESVSRRAGDTGGEPLGRLQGLGDEKGEDEIDASHDGEGDEYLAPPADAQQQRPKERGENGADDDKRLQKRHRELEVLVGIGILDERRDIGLDQTKAHGLSDAKRREHEHRRGKRAAERGDGENRTARHEDRLTPELVRKRSRDENREGRDEHEHEHREVEKRCRGIELVKETGKRRHVHVDREDERRVDDEHARQKGARPEVFLWHGELHGP